MTTSLAARSTIEAEPWPTYPPIFAEGRDDLDPEDPDHWVNVWRREYGFVGGHDFTSDRGERLEVALEALMHPSTTVRRARLRVWFSGPASLPSIVREWYPGYVWMDGSALVVTDDFWMPVSPKGRTVGGGRCEEIHG